MQDTFNITVNVNVTVQEVAKPKPKRGHRPEGYIKFVAPVVDTKQVESLVADLLESIKPPKIKAEKSLETLLAEAQAAKQQRKLRISEKISDVFGAKMAAEYLGSAV